jgi:hypothetical protein
MTIFVKHACKPDSTSQLPLLAAVILHISSFRHTLQPVQAGLKVICPWLQYIVLPYRIWIYACSLNQSLIYGVYTLIIHISNISLFLSGFPCPCRNQCVEAQCTQEIEPCKKQKLPHKQGTSLTSPRARRKCRGFKETVEDVHRSLSF